MSNSGLWRTGAALFLLLAGSCAQAAPDIAVLLPQSGRMAKAAEAIRDGLLAAYYQDIGGTADTPSLHFYDSDSIEIAALVHQAVQNGASFIIGPLDRDRLDTLLKAGPPPVPLLALNNAEGQEENVFKFALAPEDEIRRLVEWMESRGIRHPQLIGSSDDTSQRHLKFFQAQWALRHGDPLAVAILDPARKGGIAAGVKEMLRTSENHTDALFLASPSLARQVQPALTYYRSDLPLYSLASAWDPTADASGQNDLDGLRICDLPWMLEDDRPEQQALYDAYKRPAAGYDRLYAFGADAWTLSRRWQALIDGEAVSLRSGLVTPDPAHNLVRTPTCAEVRNGSATTLWAPEANSRQPGSSR